MPELPEVEVIIRNLRQKIVNRKIKSLNVFYEKVVQNIDLFKKILNKTFLDIQRKGKFLLFFLSDFWVLVGHLRMEGKINITSLSDCSLQHRHEHFRIFLDNDTVLRYYDFRKFGRFILYPQNNFLQISKLDQLGPDPFEIVLRDFFNKLKKSKIAVKKFLLDQKMISGIGNIYASEILFLSQIHPESRSCDLNLEQAQKILVTAKRILTKAISFGGSSISTFEVLGVKGSFQNHLLVYKKENKNCNICQNLIQQKKIGGRSTFFCLKCQKKIV